jgi:hypothetical protein
MKLTPIQKKIKTYLETHRLSAGLGTPESTCTIAAINLAISGRITSSRPDCVCPVIHKWVIPIQDAMPDHIRNNGWTKLVPLIAGSYAPEKEQARKNIILQWMWGVVLPQLTPIAEKHGFAKEWLTMLELKTSDAARVAARVAGMEGAASRVAARAAGMAARAGAGMAAIAAYAAYAGADAAHADNANANANAGYWEAVNPTALLASLLSV